MALRKTVDRLEVDRILFLGGIGLLVTAHAGSGVFSWLLLAVGVAALGIGAFAGGYRVAEDELDSSFLQAGGTES